MIASLLACFAVDRLFLLFQFWGCFVLRCLSLFCFLVQFALSLSHQHLAHFLLFFLEFQLQFSFFLYFLCGCQIDFLWLLGLLRILGVLILWFTRRISILFHFNIVITLLSWLLSFGLGGLFLWLFFDLAVVAALDLGGCDAGKSVDFTLAVRDVSLSLVIYEGTHVWWCRLSGHVGLRWQKEQIVDWVDDVLRANVFLALLSWACGDWSVHAQVGHSLKRIIVILEHVWTTKRQNQVLQKVDWRLATQHEMTILKQLSLLFPLLALKLNLFDLGGILEFNLRSFLRLRKQLADLSLHLANLYCIKVARGLRNRRQISFEWVRNSCIWE